MLRKARSGRDAFKFSLKGLTATASFGPLPAISDERINRFIDQRMCQRHRDPRDMARRVEDLLARYFAQGWDQVARTPGR